jgi:hypothetical protein
MVVIVLLAFLWSINPEIHQKMVFRYLKYIFFIFLIYKVVDNQTSLRGCILVYILSICYVAFLAWQVGRTGEGRLEGIGIPDAPDVNGVAAVVVTSVPLVLYIILFSAEKWLKGVAVIALAFVLNALILMNSRGALVGLIASMSWFSFIIFSQKGIRSAKWKLVAGLVCGLFLFVYLADDSFWARMETLQNVDAETGSGHRILYWLKTFEMLGDHPFGMGAMGFQLASPDYLPAEWMASGEGVRAVHSTWFEVLSEYGYQGLIVFMGYIASTFFLARKVKHYLIKKGERTNMLQLVALESAFIGFIVASTFINRFYAEIMYWLPAFIAVFANIYMLKPQREESGQHSNLITT